MRRFQKWRISKKCGGVIGFSSCIPGKTEWFYQNELRKARANNRYYLIGLSYTDYIKSGVSFKLGLTKEESL
jgi:hypothetical protein